MTPWKDKEWLVLLWTSRPLSEGQLANCSVTVLVFIGES